MDLEKLSARLRPRKPGEAMDLGVCMVREHAGVVLLPWFLIVGPIVGVIHWLQPATLGVLVIWWLLPLFARIPLFVLSRALFGDVPEFGRVLRELPRMFTRFLVWPLTIGRLSPMWVFELPVSELEHQRGSKHKQRCRVLRLDQDSSVWGLSLMSGLMVLCVWGGLLAATTSLVEIFQGGLLEQLDYDATSGAFTIPTWVYLLLGVSLVLVAPFHVASGFGLYLNRRLHLEGWDVELTFRRLAKRIRDAKAATVKVLAPLLLSLVCLSGAVVSQDRPPAEARIETATPQSGSGEPQTVIKEILAHRDFGGEREIRRWNYTGGLGSFSGGPGLGLFGELLWIVMWGAGIGVFVWILYKLITSWLWGREQRGDEERGPPPAEVMGLDVRPESLPSDLATEAWRLWLAGDAAGCLGLLYRGSLAFLIHEKAVDIRRSFTESDCLRVVGGTCEMAMSRYFGGLTSAWQSCAYAHRVPLESIAKQLCDRWTEYFGGDR